jgi:Vacuolar protein sorting 55
VQVLAIGFLLVILSAALWKNYLTLLVVLTYVLAPLPNWLCGKATTHDDFMDGGGTSVVDLGRFITGGFVAMGIGMSN